MIPLYVESKKKKKSNLIETERRAVVSKGRDVENQGHVVKMYKLVGKEKKILVKTVTQ